MIGDASNSDHKIDSQPPLAPVTPKGEVEPDIGEPSFIRHSGIFSKARALLSMAFADRKKEERFLSEQRDNTARHLRWASIVGAIIMIGFLWQDTLMSTNGLKAIYIRIFGALPVSALVWYLSRKLAVRRFISYISAFFWLSYACFTAEIFIIYGPGPYGLTSSIGLGSFLLLLFGILAFSNLRLWASILVGLLTLLVYVISIALWTDTVFVDFIMGDFLTAVALMIGAAIKTLFTERAQRRQFETSELLHQSYSIVEQQVRERTAELHQSEERYRTVMQSANDAIIIANGKGIIIDWNMGAEKIFGYTPAELTGKNLTAIISQNYVENHINGMKRIEQGGEHHILGKTVELIGLHKSGNEFPLELSLSEWETLKEKFFTGIIRDITIRKHAELELIEAKEKAESANKLKDAFMANISHEIRTPLSGILGMTRIIKETYQSNIKKEDEVMFEGIDISSNRIIRTIDMILDYSRLHVGEFNITPNKINISNICTNLVKEFYTAAKDKSLDLSFQNDSGDTVIFADEYSITMAISNLIDNAIKYTTKGSVNVILHKEKNDDLILDVKDTGIGINQEYLDHMFEPYRQEEMGYGRAYEGVGLGLAIVNKVLNLNNCVISVKSNKGEGTTFSINFGKEEYPLKNKSKTGKAANIIPAPEELSIEVVLLVEDDFMNQVTTRRFIENNYSVIVTASSDEAMEIIKKENIDIILMDISIKGKKNGLELTKELKASKEFFHIPIIAVTAHAFESDKKNAIEAGCDGYLSKPFTKESLLNIIALYAHK